MTRPPSLRIHLAPDDLVIDGFAGGGGASEGIRAATGRDPDIAINHDGEALAMHAINHPGTQHFCESIYDVDPVKVCAGKHVRAAWFSPDCTYHSKARGAKPFRDRKKALRRRGLAWVATRWAYAVKPDVIFLENVEEFQEWGPLLNNGRPDPARAGFTFRRWIRRFENLGYVVEWRQLRASDYGAPTSRKRLFIIARCDGAPIVWPEPTHGETRGLFPLKPYRTAAECIDWSVPIPSIFDRKKPLAENTLRRIARGIKRFILDCQDPFLVPLTHQGDARIHALSDPMPTITGANRGELALAVPFLTEHANGSKQRIFPIDEPLRTQCAEVKGGHFAVVAPFLKRDFGTSTGRRLDEPMPTTCGAAGHQSLIAPVLVQTGYGERDGQAPRALDINAPLGTVVSGGGKHALAAAFLASHYGRGENDGSDFRGPFPTITTKDHHMPVAVHLAGGRDRSADVYALLVKFYGTAFAADIKQPLDTITTKDRFGLVTVRGMPITDIGMRMLQPRELYTAQGFRPDYEIAPQVPGKNGKMKALPKTAQIRMVGNSVSPPIAEAIVRANLAHPARARKAA